MKKEDIKLYIAVGIMIIGAIAALYIGGWLMFINPIITACTAYDAGMLTGSLIMITVLKCIFSGVIGGAVFSVAYIIAIMITYTNLKRINSIKRRKKYRSIGVIDMR